MFEPHLSASQVSEYVGAIYDCVLDVGRWSATIDRLRSELGFCYAVLGIYPLTGGEVTLGVSTGIEAAKLTQLATLGEDIVELWGGDDRVSQFPLEEPIVQSEVVSAAALTRSRYYNEWARPQGVIDAVAIGLERNSNLVSTLSFGRHQNIGPIGPGEIATLRLLAPHLRRAIAICQLLELKSVTAANTSAVLETLSTPIFVVDRFMSLLHANPAGEAMLTRRDGVRHYRGRLVVDADGIAIDDAVAQMGHDETAFGRRGGTGFPVRSASGDQKVIHVLPLQRRQQGSDLFRRATAALFITDQDRDIPVPRAAFAALYGLTPAEVRIAELIVNGISQREISRQLGLRPSTVKTHLLHVFEKTGVQRQVDLVRLAASLAGPTTLWSGAAR